MIPTFRVSFDHSVIMLDTFDALPPAVDVILLQTLTREFSTFQSTPKMTEATRLEAERIVRRKLHELVNEGRLFWGFGTERFPGGIWEYRS